MKTKIIKRIWIVPEEKDSTFSLTLINRICMMVSSFNISSFSLEISEQYQYPIEDSPHYHIKVDVEIDMHDSDEEEFEIKMIEAFEAEFSDTANKYCARATSNYYASFDDSFSYKGFVDVNFSTNADSPFIGPFFAILAFGLYNEAILNCYPEWRTTYWGLNIHNPDNNQEDKTIKTDKQKECF